MKLTKGRIYKLLSINKQTRKQLKPKLNKVSDNRFTKKHKQKFNLQCKTLKHHYA